MNCLASSAGERCDVVTLATMPDLLCGGARRLLPKTTPDPIAATLTADIAMLVAPRQRKRRPWTAKLTPPSGQITLAELGFAGGLGWAVIVYVLLTKEGERQNSSARS